MIPQKTKIFISYSHHDRAVCETIANALVDVGAFSVWYDTELIAGEEFRSKITEEIRNTDFFLILLSDTSVCSDWVLDEVEYAKKLHKTIIPIWIEDVTLPDHLDMILQRYHGLFWHLRTSDSQFIDTLHTALCEENVFTDEQDILRENLLLDENLSYHEDFVAAYEDFKQNRLDSAFQGFSRLAAEKNAKAQLMLARMYAHGLGTSKNPERADFWYSSAAKLGDAEAQYTYGSILADATDSDKKKEQAYRTKGLMLLKDAADHKYQLAMEKYIHVSQQNFCAAVDFSSAIGYCNQLIQTARDPYERAKYAKAKRSLYFQQAKLIAKKLKKSAILACYFIGMLTGFTGALYLLTGLLPEASATSTLLQNLPSVTQDALIPFDLWWDWVLTFLNTSGAFGLELILLGTVIRTMTVDCSTWKPSRLINGVSLVFYAGIVIWYVKTYSVIGSIFDTGHLKTVALALAAVFVVVVLGYILSAILSGLLSTVLPAKTQKTVS